MSTRITAGAIVRHRSILGIAAAGMFAFAIAMGIGRFAFTPLLPIMQKDAGLTLSMGAWLAVANYLGYLAGALAAIWIRIRPALWLALRGLAGIASAWGLIFASAAILPRLAAAGKQRLSGLVFGGVGLGM